MTASAYAVLGVSPDSEDVVIRAAYRALMQKYTSLARLHDDVGADDRRAREIQAAYDAIEAARREPAPPAAPAPTPVAAPLAGAPAATIGEPFAEPLAAPDPPPPPPAFLAAPAPVVHAPPRRSGTAALVAVALVATAGGAATLWAVRPRSVPEADAVKPALRVHVGPAPAASPLARPMPCFVDGRSVGVLRLSDCAARNGVASGPLEIGPIPAPMPAEPPPVVEARAATPPPVSPRAAPAARPAPVQVEIADGGDAWRKVKAAALRFAAASFTLQDRKRAPSAPAAPPHPSHPAPAETGSLNAQMAQLQSVARTAPKEADTAAADVVDHLGQLLTRLAPLVHEARTDPAPPTHPAPASGEVAVPIAAPALVEPAVATTTESPPEARATPHPGARESVAVVRDFYQALGEGDARLATTLVAPEERESGSLSADRIRRFAASVRQPVRLTGIHALDDSTVAVRYQYVSSANQLCEGMADVATTARDDRVLIRGIKSTYAC